jgi:glucose-1-phosphate adenylyltransferase
MLRTLALIMAGGESPALSVLSAERNEAATPFAGKFRIIDFTLSNCVNSGIYNVGVLTQYQPREIHEHIGVGKPWDLDRSTGGVRILHPSPTKTGGGWQKGTADAVRYNLAYIEEQQCDLVLVLAGDHVYKMNYRPLLEWHAEHDADMTIAVHSVSPHETQRYGIVVADGDGRVSRFEEKPRRSLSSLASMGIYVFRKSFLRDVMAGGGETDFGRELLPKLVSKATVWSYNFQGYWADVGTVQAYYEANMGLLAETPALDLYDPEWVIHTRSLERPAAEIGAEARVDGNLLCDGSRVHGTVSRSILSPGVYVAPGAVVRDSILLGNVSVGAGAVIDRCIVDQDVEVGAGALLGDGNDNTPNAEHPHLLNTGLTLVGQRAQIPEGVRVGRNVVVYPRSTAAAFSKSREIDSGATVGRRG